MIKTARGLVRPVRRGRRGYTLIEVTIAAALTAAMLVLLFRWVVGLGGVVVADLATANTDTMARAAEQVMLDVMTAAHCTASGTDPRVREVSPARVALVVTTDAGGSRSVVWRMASGLLQRGEAPMLADCVFVEPSAWTTWAQGFDLTESRFAATVAGAASAVGPAGQCTSEFEARCRVSGIDVRLKSTEDSLVVHRVLPLS